MSSVPQCHVCGAQSLQMRPQYEQFCRVSSDCKPWPRGGRLGICAACSSVQAVTDEAWRREAAAIYEQYTIYHQGQGAEQSVFDQNSGQAAARSSRLVERLRGELAIPERGRHLDIGCGNGAFLRAFTGSLHGWSAAGLEVNDRYRAEVESIPGVEALFTGEPAEVPGRFNLISLIHVLEHIPGPRQYIHRLWDKLEPGGWLVLQVPDCEQNPFMFLIADHASHCFRAPVVQWVVASGYELVAVSNHWVPKELTIVARKLHFSGAPPQSFAIPDIIAAVRARLGWLADIALQAQNLADHQRIGVFGTSIAGTWLFAELKGAVEFFVDEDPNRIGQTHLGRPVLGPGQVPKGSQLLLPMPPFLATAIGARLKQYPIRMHLPPSASWAGDKSSPNSGQTGGAGA